MAGHYVCEDRDRRLESIRGRPDLNGIDYLEVLGDEGPAAIPPQRTLLVRCLRPLTDAFSRSNVRVEGGVRMDPRLNPVRVEWAFKATRIASAPADDAILPADRTHFEGLPDPERLLVVRTSTIGDFSTYQLVLARGPGDDRPPAGFDPQLREVPFSFKVDCPADFDCRSDEECPPEAPAEPQIDYLAKDYASFRTLLLDRLALIMPDWKERNPADQQIALVELLAYVGDQLSYYQDAAASEAYLGTARQRVSVRRHARLLDYAMHDGCNARAWVVIEVAKSSEADGGPAIPMGTRILSRGRGDTSTIAPAGLDEALAVDPVVFETTHALQAFHRRNRIQFHTWGDLRCCLPVGATTATLRDTSPKLNLRAGDVLVLREILGPSGQAVDADPDHCQAVRLDRDPVPATDPLDGAAVLEISWHAEDALRFPLCLWQFPADTGIAGASIAHANVVLADHGIGLERPEVLPMVPIGEGVAYRPRLARPGLTHRTPYVDAAARARPAAEALDSDPRLAEPDVRLHDGRDEWSPRPDLLASDRFLAEFVVEMESDGRAFLRFGDDVLGRRPASGSVLTASYRVGGGAAGNVGPKALTRLVTDISGIGSVSNPMPAVGGADPEPVERVRQFAPQAFRTQQRAVTEADYAEVAQRRPSVQRAAATRRWTGSWYTEFVAIDRRGGLAVDRAFRADIARYFEPFRMAGVDVDIDPPTFVPLEIVLTVCVKAGYFRTDVKAELLRRFTSGRLADGSPGFFNADRLTFAQPVFLSQIVATAMAVDGVAWVDTSHEPGSVNRFGRLGQVANEEFEDGVIRTARLEVAQLDNDPNAPENGRLDFIMQGGR